jgi:hypothetical protein
MKYLKMEDISPMDKIGVLMVIGSLFTNIWNKASHVDINGIVVFLTSLGGIIFIGWKIRNERKKSKLLDLQIKEIQDAQKDN